ncbi:MAG: hypothetical protein ACTS3R_11900 [Inquilinaceae bacterium]
MNGKVIGGIVALVIVIAVAWWAIDINVTDEGELPTVDVDVDAGELPEVDVDTVDVEVGTEEREVLVPDVEVTVEEETVTVPTISVEPADANNTAN